MAMTKGLGRGFVRRVLSVGNRHLLVACLVFAGQSAFANPAEWESTSITAYGSTAAPCVPCHSNSFIQKPSLQISDAFVGSSTDTTQVLMESVVPSAYLAWRFRPTGSGINGTFVNGSSANVGSLDPGQNEFEFCVVENTTVSVNADGPTGTASWNCADFTISRNQVPVVSLSTGGNVSMDAGDSQVVTVNASDADGDALTYSAQSDDEGIATVSGPTNTSRFNVGAVSQGNTNIEFTVTDSRGESSTVTLAVAVNAVQVNRDPVLTVNSGSSRTLAIAAAIDISASATDADNNTLTFSATSRNNAIVSVERPDANGSVFRLRGVSAGNTEVDFQVDDGAGGSDTATISVTVQDNPPPNQAPVISLNTSSSAQLNSGQTLSVQPTATDAENDAVTFSAQSNNTSVASVTEVSAGNYLITAGATAGSAQVTFTASDAGGSSSDSVTVTVSEAANSSPIIIGIEPATLSLVINGTVTFSINASDDEDGTNLQFTATSSNTAVVAVSQTSTDGEFQVTANAEGSATITVEVRDSAGQSVSATVVVTVTAETVIVIDADQDGVPDLLDNCPNDANGANSSAAQADSDNDGVGDVCDPDANGDAVLDGVLLLQVTQNNRNGSVIFPTDGAVEVLADVSSGSLTDSNFSIDWSASDSTINSAITLTSIDACDAASPTQEVCGRLSLNPSGFSAGVYTVRATAMVDGLMVSANVDLLVLPGPLSTAEFALFNDADADGFPRESGADANTANPVNVSTGNSANRIFAEGQNTISLGRYAALHWSKQNFSQASVVLRYEQFLPASLQIHSSLVESSVAPLVDNAGVFNFNIRTQGPIARSQRAIIHLPGDVPAEPELLIFKPTGSSGVWQSFNGSEDSVSVAFSTGGNCPGFDDGSYVLAWGANGAAGAGAAGTDCLQINVRDGGPNDTDGLADGVVSLVFNLGNDTDDCAGCDGLFIPINNGREDLDLNPSSGGGAAAPRDLAILIGLLVLMFSTRTTRFSGRKKYL